MDLEKYTNKYKTHIKNEEDKIDHDFNGLLEAYAKDIEDIKNKLKEKL